MTTYTQAQTAWTSLMESFVQGKNTFTYNGTTYYQAQLNGANCGNMCYNQNGNCNRYNSFSSNVIGYLQTVQAYYSRNYVVNKVPCSDNTPGCLFYKLMKPVYAAFTGDLTTQLTNLMTTPDGTKYNYDSSTYHGVTTISDVNGCSTGNFEGVLDFVNAWMIANNVQLPFITSAQLPQ